MRYVQYYHKGVISGDLIPACGDRAIVILDGRNSISTSIQDSHRYNGYRRTNYPAFQVFEGENILRAKAITEIIIT